MATINQKFTGDARQLELEYQKLLEQQVKQEEQLRKVALRSKQAESAGTAMGMAVKAAGNQAATGMKNLAAQYASIQGIISFVKAEQGWLERQSQKSLELNLRMAKADEQLIKNLAPKSQEELDSFMQSIHEVVKETKFSSEVDMKEAASSVISGVSGDKQLTIEILRQIGDFTRNSPEDADLIGGAVAKVATIGKVNPKDALSLVVSTMGMAQLIDYAEFKNAAPGLASAVNSQKDTNPAQALKEAAAGFAALSISLKDEDGSRSANAIAALSGGLERVLPEGGSLKDRIEKIRSNPQQGLVDEIIKVGFDEKSKGQIRELLTNSKSDIAKQFAISFDSIKYDREGVDRMKQMLRDGTNSLTMSTRLATSEAEYEAQLKEREAAQRAEVRGHVGKALSTPGNLTGNALTEMTRMGAMDFYFGATPEEGLHIIELKKKAIRKGTNFSGIYESIFGNNFIPDKTEFTPAETSQLKALDVFAEQLKAIQKENHDILERQRKENFELLERQRRQGNAAIQARMHEGAD